MKSKAEKFGYLSLTSTFTIIYLGAISYCATQLGRAISLGETFFWTALILHFSLQIFRGFLRAKYELTDADEDEVEE